MDTAGLANLAEFSYIIGTMVASGEKKTINPLKTLVLVFVVILIINIVLFAFGKIDAFTFWMIIAFGALVAYYVVPKLMQK